MAPELTDVNRKQQKFLLSQSRFLVLLMALYFIVTSIYLVMNILAMEVHAAHGKETLVSTDSQHYLQFAHRFLKGNFSMDYIREAPHRQPLYPFALAVASKIGNGNLFFLGEVNVVAMTLVIGSVYFGVLRFFQSANIAMICALCVAGNLFMWRIAGERLLTEPLYVLLMVWVIIAFVQFLREGKIYWLLLTALLLGLAYLTRPNGIIGAAACFAVLLLAETMAPSRVGEARPPLYRKLLRLIPKYVGAGLLFIVVTIPSWLPRLVYFNNPLYTGYLTNFLWVDTYHLAHDFGIRPRYTWHDYAATHNLLDAVWRLVYGFSNVCIVLPIGAEKLPILYLLSVAGVCTALKTGPREFRFLLIFFLIQLLPLIWTNMPNPNTRVPYGSTFPFEPFFAACFLALAGARTWERLSRRVGRRPARITTMLSRFSRGPRHRSD
jgi:Dolichyl-phosphate-mannose-protein mannosyltransferase